MRQVFSLLAFALLDCAVGCAGRHTTLPPDQDAKSCTYEGKTYADGEQFPAGDGCNTCSCDEGTIGCTLIGCNPNNAASCKVGGVVYPHGANNIQDPFSCNKCSCNAGGLACTEIGCTTPCPPGTTPGTTCAQCGPTDACEIVEHACLSQCSDPKECATGFCYEGLCRMLCG